MVCLRNVGLAIAQRLRGMNPHRDRQIIKSTVSTIANYNTA